MRILFITAFACIVSGACPAAASNTWLDDNLTRPATESSPDCTDVQSLINSLHIQTIELDDETKTGFLNSIGLTIYPKKYFELSRAMRISGECATHLKGVNISMLHFDTGVTLARVDGGSWTQYPEKYRPQTIIDANDANAEMLPPQFINAVKVGYSATSSVSNFIGIRKNNDISVFTPYSKNASGEFVIYDDLLESKKEIITIRLFPALTPAGTLQVLVPDGNARILLSFAWTYRDFLWSPSSRGRDRFFQFP